MYQTKNNRKRISTKKHKDKKRYELKDADLDRIYKAIEKMEGMAGDDRTTDASTTIDEILYGENGAWRGSGR